MGERREGANIVDPTTVTFIFMTGNWKTVYEEFKANNNFEGRDQRR